MWLEKGAEKDIAGMVSDSNAFWGKVTDEDKMEVKDRPARRIRSSVAFWENCGYRWECGQLKVGEKKKLEKQGEKVGGVKFWEVRPGILEKRRKHWTEGEL